VLSPDDAYLRGVAWSPDGSKVAAGGGMDVHLWDVSSGQVIGTWHGHTGPIYGMAWSPRTNLLASSSADGTVRLWNGADGSTVRVLRDPAISPVSVNWSPTGATLAVGSFNGSVALVEADTGSISVLPGGPPRQNARGSNPYAVYGVSWSPDGTRLVSTRYDGYIFVWDVHSTRALATLRVDSLPNAVVWSPDGNRFASSHDDGTVHFWDGTTYEAGMTLSVALDQDGWAFPMAWSPDGQLLAVARQTGLVQWWDTSSAKQLAALSGHVGGVWAIGWSPDGTRVASASDDTTVRLWGIR
jgi:WD40 repeat protein